jgi:hypothetical protein
MGTYAKREKFDYTRSAYHAVVAYDAVQEAVDGLAFEYVFE